MKNQKGVFVYYAPDVIFSRIHLHRPYIEYPLSFSNDGYSSFLIVSRNMVKGNLKFNILELFKSEHKLRGLGKLLNSYIYFVKLRPKIFVFFHLNAGIPIFYLLSKIFFMHTKFYIKLDWDGTVQSKTSSPVLNKFKGILFLFSAITRIKLIIENSCSRRTLLSYSFLKQKDLILLRNSASLDFIAAPLKKVPYRDEESIILVVSRINKAKGGIDILIKAFSKMYKENPSWTINVVGPVEDNDYYNYLRDLIHSLKLDSKIHFLGPKYDSDLKYEYLRSKIFCLPSLREGDPISRIEAIFFGIPILISSAGCSNDLLPYGATVFKAGDADDLHCKLRLLTSSESLRRNAIIKQKNFIKERRKIPSVLKGYDYE